LPIVDLPDIGGHSSSQEMGNTVARVAFGAPGIEQRWTSSSKDGLGTSRSEGRSEGPAPPT
jgi:hypothetical protein